MRGKSWAVLFAVVLPAMVFLATGCDSGEVGREEPGKVYQDGDFTGESEDGDVEVTLTFQDEKIVDVKIIEYGREGEAKDIESYMVCVGDEREPLLAEAHPAFISQMINENTVEIDTFTGATATTDSVREAAKAALESAKTN